MIDDIMKKADREYDMFSELEATHPELRGEQLLVFKEQELLA